MYIDFVFHAIFSISVFTIFIVQINLNFDVVTVVKENLITIIYFEFVALYIMIYYLFFFFEKQMTNNVKKTKTDSYRLLLQNQTIICFQINCTLILSSLLCHPIQKWKVIRDGRQAPSI